MIVNFYSCAVIVAHPDDETIWAGGTVLINPQCSWTIVSLCRKNDPDRAPKFFKALSELNAQGSMGEVDDGPNQFPLPPEMVENTILSLLTQKKYDLILTHSIHGEYTRHRRHEETANAVLSLWRKEEIISKELWMFAFDDQGGSRLPNCIVDADKIFHLSEELFRKKKSLIRDIYGFNEESWEARATPASEAFWCFSKESVLNINRINRKDSGNESAGAL